MSDLSHKNVSKRRPGQVYIIEITDFIVCQNINQWTVGPLLFN